MKLIYRGPRYLINVSGINGTLKIHTTARKFQLGVVIIQKGKPIGLYSRKLTDPLKGNTVTEKDTLSIAETIK